MWPLWTVLEGCAATNADIELGECPGWGSSLIPTKDPKGPLESLSRDSLFYFNRVENTCFVLLPPGDVECGNRNSVVD